MRDSVQFRAKLHGLLSTVYDKTVVDALCTETCVRVETLGHIDDSPVRGWQASDVMLITYGDAFSSADRSSLETLHAFFEQRLSALFSTVHILPFFPYTSDDGFAVSDYLAVDPALGTWADVVNFGKAVDLMFDFPLNHASSAHKHFIEFLNDETPGNTYFVTAPADADVSMVTRPRAHQLLQEFETKSGAKHLWCTFSRDQIDWDFGNPAVLLLFVDILLFYIKNGAKWLRLDAIAYLWKELGSNCIHLPQTHALVQVFRLISEYVQRDFRIITETNVPNEENLSYFGAGDEAHLVYNFSLPPLVLHALLSGQSQWLMRWCNDLPQLPQGCTYLNFLASHDGVGMRPVEGLIPKSELEEIFRALESFGGLLTNRRCADGSLTPYEANISYFDAVKGTYDGIDEWQIERFLSAHAIMLSLAGVPAVYYNSLLATPNYVEGVEQTQRNRTINRRKWSIDEVDARLEDPSQPSFKVFRELERLIKARRSEPAFSPGAKQYCIDAGSDVFVLCRESTEANSKVICCFNLSSAGVELALEQLKLPTSTRVFRILGSGQPVEKASPLQLGAYEFAWLKIMPLAD